MSTCSQTHMVNSSRLIITEPTYNSHATPIDKSHISTKKETNLELWRR